MLENLEKETDFEALKTRVEAALKDIKEGKMLIVVDDESRENEGDLIFAAEHCSAEHINFMAKHARGLICLAMEPELIDKLQLPMMTLQNQALHETAFTVSIEARHGVSTGISAQDRSHTILTAIADGATRGDLVVPGHIFPLKAKAGGVLVRSGHTEAAVDLARLAGLKGAGVICELLSEDGTMARRPELETMAERFGLKILSIEDLMQYRRLVDFALVKAIGTDNVAFTEEQRRVFGGKYVQRHRFLSHVDGTEHWALSFSPQAESLFSNEHIPLVREHSEQQYSDPLGAFFQKQKTLSGVGPYLESAENIAKALERLSSATGYGFFVYVRHGAQSDAAASTGAELRQLGVGAQILKMLGVGRMHLLTDSPKKLVGLQAFSLEIVEQLPLTAKVLQAASSVELQKEGGCCES